MTTQIVRKPMPETGKIEHQNAIEIAPPLQTQTQVQQSQSLDDLIKAYKDYKKDVKSYQSLNYNETDIVALVEHAGEQEPGTYEHSNIGAYIGELISELTEKNERLGQRTIIEIPVNKLQYLGKECKKFDVVKIGKNEASSVFSFAKNGNLLYVEQNEEYGFASYSNSINAIVVGQENGSSFALYANCANIIAAKDVKGSSFANSSGTGNRVGAIIAGNVTGDDFGKCAGRKYGHVNLIAAKEINCPSFATLAGSNDGHVEKILAGRILGETRFSHNAGHYEGRVDIIGGKDILSSNFATGLHSRIQSTVKLLKGYDAELEYISSIHPIVQELGNYGLDFTDLLDI